MRQLKDALKQGRTYQMCRRCVMDTTDPLIEFDEKGLCNHCRTYEHTAQVRLLNEPERTRERDRLVREIKRQGQGLEYDCVIGVSGGVDSTYVASLCRKLGLRPLAIHMDNGWDDELAVDNIEKTLKKLNIDLHTYVLDWEEFRELQRAFLRASVSDAEIPTDHAIWAVLYDAAAKRGIKNIILGTNVATEGIMTTSWTYGVLDWRYIQDVHRRYGQRPLKSFPHVNFYQRFFHYPHVKGIEIISLLDYVPYNKQEVIRELEGDLGWRPYGGKHYESIYTRFFQGYILPRRFGIDKRKAHCSTLVMSGQMTREQALELLKSDPYEGHDYEGDRLYVIKKLEFSPEEFDALMAQPRQTYEDFRNSAQWIQWLVQSRRLPLGEWGRRWHLLPQRKADVYYR